MKNFILIAILLFIGTSVFAQVPLNDEIVKMNSVSDEDMNAILSPFEGSVVFNTTAGRLYQYDGVQWLQLDIKKPRIKTLTGNYTLTATDDNFALVFNTTSDVTLTVPSGLVLGFNVSIYQSGTGTVTVQGSGANVRNRLLRFRTAGQYAAAGLLCTATNEFYISGDLKR